MIASTLSLLCVSALWVSAGISQSLADLQVIQFESNDTKYFTGQTYQFTGKLQISGITVGDTYTIDVILNGASIYSEAVTATLSDQERLLSVDVQFVEPGFNRLVLFVDSDNEITEANEENNRAIVNLNVLDYETIVRPNPFTPNNDGFNDEVLFQISDSFNSQTLEVTIFTLSGKKMRTLATAGGTDVSWDGRDDQNDKARPGTYLYVMKADGETIQRGTILLAL